MRRLLSLVGVLVVFLATAAPISAAPPEESGVVLRIAFPFGQGFEDADDGLVALGGPPPELGCFGEGFEEVLHHIVVTPAGPVKILVKDVEEPFFIYAASSIGEVCEAVFAGEVPEPIATGTARVVLNDNNLFNSGPGANSFGATATGTVYDADGNPWHFNASVRLLNDTKGEFRVLHEDINLVKLGG